MKMSSGVVLVIAMLLAGGCACKERGAEKTPPTENGFERPYTGDTEV